MDVPALGEQAALTCRESGHDYLGLRSGRCLAGVRFGIDEFEAMNYGVASRGNLLKNGFVSIRTGDQYQRVGTS